MDDPAVLAPGTVIAPGYQVVEHLSRGEALDVYEVFSAERLCSCIAKTIRPDRVGVERVQARLLQEGRLLQELAHPLLVRGYETIPEPQIVVILETVTALNLEELLEQRARRLPIVDICHLGATWPLRRTTCTDRATCISTSAPPTCSPTRGWPS